MQSWAAPAPIPTIKHVHRGASKDCGGLHAMSAAFVASREAGCRNVSRPFGRMI